MLSLVLASVSKTPFYIMGGALAAYAVVLAAIGITQPSFPYSKAGQRGVILLSTVMVAATIAVSVLTSSIEQLAEKSNYLEVAYLLIHGDLPTESELASWVHEITIHTFVHENIKEFMQGFRYDAHPMGMLLASVGALSTFYPEASAIKDEETRYMQIIRLIAKMPTLAAFSYRHNRGMPYVYPDNDLSYPGNFLSMIYKMTELKYEPDPRLEHALDVLFILHADHEQNCSTSAVRSVGSSQVDPYSAVAAGVAALYGPLHGGANEAVLRMLKRIETKENVPDFIKGVKDGNERLMGFGHRVYKNYDPG